MTRMTRIRWQITPKLLQYYSSMATGALLVKQWSHGREVHRVVCRTGVLYTVSHQSTLHRVAPESFVREAAWRWGVLPSALYLICWLPGTGTFAPCLRLVLDPGVEA